MFTHQLKILFRSMIKNRVYSTINFVGLSIGLASCLLITLYILDELSYDKFHTNHRQTYRLSTHAQMGENTWNSAVVSPALAPVVVDEIPEVTEAVRLDQFNRLIFKNEERIFQEDKVLAADVGFFKIFDFPLLEGNPEEALAEPYSVLLTKNKIEKYFDSGIKPMGKSILIDNTPYQITGILADIPKNSHLQFEIVFSFNTLSRAKNPKWQNSNTITYLHLQENTNGSAIESKIAGILAKYSENYRQIKEAGFHWAIQTTPLRDIHLKSHLEDELGPNGYINNMYILGLIAFFILLIAGINFVNLSTAKSADRAKEVGIRKTLGSSRQQLIRQFMAESISMVIISMIFAMLLVQFFKPHFYALIGKESQFDLFSHPLLMLALLIISILIGIAAGMYPSFYLSRFQATKVLSGRLSLGARSGWLRNALVVVQYVIAICLIGSTLIISKQLKYMQSKNLGYDKENVVLLRNAEELGGNFNAFLQSLKGNSRIISASYSDYGPFDDVQGSMFLAQGADEKEARIINFIKVDPDYIPTMGMELMEGRNFSKEMGADSASIILNEEAVKSLGLTEPIGQLIQWDGLLKVVGVLKNFHFKSLQDQISPLILMPAEQGKVIEVRLGSGDMVSNIANLENTWSAFNENGAPIDYSFVDSDYEALYVSEKQMGSIIQSFSLLAIFISCLGLFALAAFVTERRTKEIGIRKILGATIQNIVMLVSKEFIILICIAAIISIPLTYFSMKLWLENYSYRAIIGANPYLKTIVLALIIAMLTVSYHAIKSAIAEPVCALKDE